MNCRCLVFNIDYSYVWSYVLYENRDIKAVPTKNTMVKMATKQILLILQQFAISSFLNVFQF